MLFNAPAFIALFLPASLILYSLSRKLGLRAAHLAIVAISLFFYSLWAPADTVILLASIGFNYAMSAVIAGGSLSPRRQLAALAFSVSVNLLALAYYKYAAFIVANIATLTGIPLANPGIHLPLAISFFTFTQIAFLVDVLRREAARVDFLDYLLFVTFFPHLIAGPVYHHKEMMPQFRELGARPIDATNLSAGLLLFSIGLLKKVGLADSVMGYADQVFAAARDGQALVFTDAWGGSLAFAFQIYFDFSGYTDMAMGLALMFGVRLPLNFDSPYKARSIIEFWRRWHITLSRFLRDYLYISLGGNRLGLRRRYLNLMLTMLIGGLWHGAAWTFVIWGGLHGAYLFVNHLWRSTRDQHAVAAEWTPPHRAFLWQLLTFLCVVVAWVFFRADGIHAAGAVLKAMAGAQGVLRTPQFMSWQAGALLSCCLAIVWLLPNSQQITARFGPALQLPPLAAFRGWWQSIAQPIGLVGSDGTLALTRATGALVSATILGCLLYQALRTTELKPFIYFQF